MKYIATFQETLKYLEKLLIIAQIKTYKCSYQKIFVTKIFQSN